MKRSFILFALLLVACVSFGQDYTPKYQLINKTEYPTSDLGVATYNILDYGADPTGEEDCTKIIQTLCDKLAGKGTKSSERGNWQNICGGVLYLPAGTYKVSASVYVPVGVTIRGDWKEPTKTQPVSGTVIKACPIESVKDSKALFIMYPCSQVCNLTVWYPEQDINNVKQYAATFLYGKSSFWGNEYCNVRNVTLLNSYIGIRLLASNGGGCPNIWNIYGTPLNTGVEIDAIADVGRFDGISFAPDYWANSGLAGAPTKAEIAQYTRQNATGVVMKRNDWSYTCNFDADSYKVGFFTTPGVDGSKPNGHNYNFHFTNCETGVLCEASSGAGIMFSRVKTESCEAGVRINGGCSGPVQLFECDLQGWKYPLGADNVAGATVNVQDCRLEGDVHFLSGQLIADGNTFEGNVTIASPARTIFTGNTVNGTFTNNSIYKCVVSDEKTAHNKMPEYKDEWMKPRTTKPAKNNIFVVTDEAYGCVPIAMTDPLDEAPDCSVAIQKALNDAGNAGGGIVYLPAGHYRMDGNLSIPAGVELKGSSDLPAIPHGHGSILECYAGQGQDGGTPFITMGEGSGLRGITINYPTQCDPSNVQQYPYTVRGNKNVYIVNVSMRAAYKVFDLFTNKCDNHYVDYISGHAFNNVITVGGGSENGMVSNIQCNTIAYGAGFETKFGHWPNSESFSSDNSVCGTQNARDLEFLVLEDTNGEILYDNFLYGCNKGMYFKKGSNGRAPRNTVSLGNAVDGAVNTFVFDALESDLDLTNSQIVALNNASLNAYFITTGADVAGHTINFFSSDMWGGGNYLAKVQGGTLNMYNMRCEQSGAKTSFNVSEGAQVNVLNGIMNNVKKLSHLTSCAPRISIYSTVLDPTGTTTSTLAAYKNNLATGWEMGSSDALLSRTGWKTTASNDTNGTGNSKNAIDGKSNTRWDTGAVQTAGQWFAVDFGSELTFNSIILDTMNSSSDGPDGYTVETQTEGSDTWTQVAEGSNGSAMLVITFEKVQARKVRINQTGSKTSNYWSIHEFNVGNLDTIYLDDVPEGISTVYQDADNAAVQGVYDLQGRRLGDDASALKSGLYIVNGKKMIKK